eukprot:10157913-Alexandrium_andersonii.AAC.1
MVMMTLKALCGAFPGAVVADSPAPEVSQELSGGSMELEASSSSETPLGIFPGALSGALWSSKNMQKRFGRVGNKIP